MKRRNLLGTIAGAAGVSLALGTGAFSSTRAERTISAEVANDSEAYLEIDAEAVGIAGRSSQVNIGYNGEVTVFRIPGPEDDLVGGTDPAGVGENSEYWFANMAVIRNQGNQPITVYSHYSGELDQIAIFDSNDTNDPPAVLRSRANGRKLNVGESFTMGIYIKTGDQNTGSYDEEFGIIAETT